MFVNATALRVRNVPPTSFSDDRRCSGKPRPGSKQGSSAKHSPEQPLFREVLEEINCVTLHGAYGLGMLAYIDGP